MKKSLVNRERIALFLDKNPGKKSTEIASELGMTRVAIYLHLQTLITEGRIESRGRSTATRYFPISPVFSDRHLLDDIQALLSEKYGEIVSEESIAEAFRQYMMYIDAQGMISYGLGAFILWCHDPRHEYASQIAEKAVEYIDLIGSIEYLRGKNRLLDVTLPAKEILK